MQIYANLKSIIRNALSLLLIIMSCLCAGFQSVLAEELTRSQSDEIELIIRNAMQKANYPAASVVVNMGGKEIFNRAYGTADLENNVPATLNSVYAIGSITKSFTALAILQLVDNGKLALDDTVESILKAYQGPGRQVTISQLLTHSSGIPNYLNEIPDVRGTFKRRAVTREQMMAYFEGEPLRFEPGEQFNYSNSGYYLLGIIIEQVSGLSYYEYLQTHILQPFGLDSVFDGNDSELVPDRVRGYDYIDGQYLNASPWHYLAPFSAGSLLATASDLAKYRRAVFQSDKISSTLRDLVKTTLKLKDGTPSIYALGGLIESEFNGRLKYSHSGEIYGFFSNHSHYPNEDLTIIVLTNNKGTSPTPISIEHKIARVVFEIPAPDILDKQLSDVVLDQYVGEYRVGPVNFGPARYAFIAQDKHLHLRFGGLESKAPLIPLLAQGNGYFVMATDDGWSFEFNSENNPSDSFRMFVRDATVSGSRVK